MFSEFMQFKFNSEVFDNIAAFDQDQTALCCCKPNIPHDESMKFILKAKDQNMTLTIFKNQPAGKVSEENGQKQKNTNVHFDSSMVYYRNEYIQCIVNLLINSNNKILEVTGVSGVGKNSIVKAAAGYIVDRNFFPDGVFLLHMDPKMSCIE